MEFHISRQARDRYQFDQSIFAYSGNVIFANFHASRQFAQKINQKRDLVVYPERAVRAGQINALGLIDEIMHHIVALYRRQKNPQAMTQALDWLEGRIGPFELERTLIEFCSQFPPMVVFRGEQGISEYLDDATEGVPNREVALEEMLLLWLANENSAFSPFQELFDDRRLSNETAYRTVIQQLHSFFDTQPHFGPDQQNLIDMLRSPAIAVPNSLFGQLEYIRERWAELLGRYLYRLLTSLDLIKEEEKIIFPGFGPGPIPIPTYDRWMAEAEPERFTPDKDWMPRLVLIAKNSYVWLDQLSKKYHQSINHLDQIPDEELNILARWGFTGLWLIGVWERSRASARIKQLCGNPEAISSAYSLYGYQIAQDLGGEEAYRNLRERAWRRGIRMASDMVPNHMAIDSPWLIEHPDWFISLQHSPFPAYTFNGPDLSPNEGVGIFLEDHYYSRTDAAVVFKRVDRSTGQEKYIYHGNDGTNMPWNDTAQLNYLNPTVREAVIQTILEVARRFPIIRFDAAMTLAKRHYQRLWFPEPGSGGDIPTRAEYGMTKEQFDALFPAEFWREVVDRAAVEAPDTLLLAEAFWLMEGYFVRTLGMHRVYNSAFMNMLRNEDNGKYRLVMKNTLEFEPEILKRYVNFMNNPDERTAVDQFGKGDKYFGICIVMATLPGLPMFGHGQIEGFSEKYGMEYRRAYWDETVDTSLVERHEREVFPLLHRRAQFAGVENFLLYDFFSPSGTVNEDVFAYSNGLGNDRNLVVYHNRFASTQGWIRTSVGYSIKVGSTDERRTQQRTLGEGLNLQADENVFVVFRDQITSLEYIRPSKQLCEEGLYVELNAYKYHVFLDFHQVHDDPSHSYSQLCNYLAGRGVPSINEALEELLLQPIQNPFRLIANKGYFDYMLSFRVDSAEPLGLDPILQEARQKTSDLLEGIMAFTHLAHDQSLIVDEVCTRLKTALSFLAAGSRFSLPSSKNYASALVYLRKGLEESPSRWLVIFAWIYTHNLGRMAGQEDYALQSLSWLDEWKLGRILNDTFLSFGVSLTDSDRMISMLRILIEQQAWYRQSEKKQLDQIVEDWLANSDVQRYLGINRYKDTLWFHAESLQEFIWWMTLVAVLEKSGDPQLTASAQIETVIGAYEIAQKIIEAEKLSNFQVTKLLKNLELLVLPGPI